ncbi:MAG TPA: 30S ribosomal protein S6 [Candidatus Paceibacterota bacterium]|nr:30S ribosomal protein S6 [Candidatus Paceibacterota bacterium]
MSEDKKTKEYEITFWLKDEAGIDKMKSILNNHGITPAFVSELKRVNLAYPIKKETSAFLGNMNFITDSEKIQEASKELRVDGELLRFMVSKDPAKPQPMQEREGREMRRPVQEQKVEKTEPKSSDMVTNEELEKKLEEILK